MTITRREVLLGSAAVLALPRLPPLPRPEIAGLVDPIVYTIGGDRPLTVGDIGINMRKWVPIVFDGVKWREME